MNGDQNGQKRGGVEGMEAKADEKNGGGVEGTEAKADERNGDGAVENGIAGTGAASGGVETGASAGGTAVIGSTATAADEITGDGTGGRTAGIESGSAFAHKLRVRYHETDQMGVVYHANYLNWFEIARTELIREIGFPYVRLEEEGLLLPVLSADVQYLQPAKYDDEVEIEVKLVECTPLRLGFTYVVRRLSDGRELATGGSRHVWMNRDWKPARLDRAMPDLYAVLRGLVSGSGN